MRGIVNICRIENLSDNTASWVRVLFRQRGDALHLEPSGTGYEVQLFEPYTHSQDLTPTDVSRIVTRARKLAGEL